MKKLDHNSLLFKFIIVVGIILILAIASFVGMNFFDTNQIFSYTVKDCGAYENNLEMAVPQTKVYDLVEKHFSDNQTVTTKKAIVIGYDAVRADSLSSINDEDSAIEELKSDGGHVALAYCGGSNYPDPMIQESSTAPGWCSQLTGVWADKHGVYNNNCQKNSDCPTLLKKLVEEGKAKSSAFYGSWSRYINDANSIYGEEKASCEQSNLAVKYESPFGDGAVVQSVKNNVNQDTCSDFIFAVLENPDIVGHMTGYSPSNPIYRQAFYSAEHEALSIIKTIKARDNYKNEDWLIIISSDHGGFWFNHGGDSLQERMTFIATN